MSKIKSNCTYEDTLSIYSKLPASDKRWFHNKFIDSPATRFRWIEYYNGDKAGFVELYDIEKNGNLIIAIAILPAYRNKGLLHKLVAKAEEYTNSTKSYNRLVWCALFGNTRSMEAAKHMGFTFFRKEPQDMVYIKDLKLDNNSIQKKIKELNDKLNKEIDFGIVVNGKVITDDDYISNNFKKYKTLSPADFEKYKVGVCWDFCNYQSYYFNKYLPNVKYKLIYIESGINNMDNEKTHTFMVYELNNKWYLFESAWLAQQGIREFSSFNKLIEYYIKVYRNYSKNHDTLFVYEYTPPNKYGQNIYEFMDHCKSGKLVKRI